jgi:hypothetical protein
MSTAAHIGFITATPLPESGAFSHTKCGGGTRERVYRYACLRRLAVRRTIVKSAFRVAVASTVLLVASTVAEAQWLNLPTPGTPRLPDGSANLNAAPPKTADGKPDFSGIWRSPTGKYLANLAADGVDAPMTAWARQIFKARQDNNGLDRPSASCLPHSVTDFDAHNTPRKVLQSPGLLVMLFEGYHSYRQIFTDGRALPKDPEPAWFGYSVGRWQGDTLVVDTNGINEKTWLDDAGHPHSDAMHIVERFRRATFGRMDVQITIEDPKAYTKPWTVSFTWELMPDTDLLDWVCENNRYFDVLPKDR